MRTISFVIRFAGSGVLAATTAMTAIPAQAQEATPAAGAVQCTTEPRDVEELVGFYFDPQGTPLATPTAATSVNTEAELPRGEAVDPTVEAELNATLAELIACFEEGQYARAFALMTDDLARQTGPDVNNPDEDTPEEVRALLEEQLAGTPVVDEPGMAEGAATDVGQGRDIRVLEGGRVGGVWTIEGDAAFVVFEEQDDRWLIDEFIDIVEDEAAMSGTPEP
ncbi:MAG: hypothetical protein KY456_08385 [Chloroflexi bacterium]|nr:hypothetical protein [Chloroflexota bacterium]